MAMNQQCLSTWDGGAAGLFFGVEHERFVFGPDRPPTDAAIGTFFDLLLAAGGRCTHRDRLGRCLTVKLSVDEHEVSIKNDFCSHIVETVFPPLQRAATFRHLFDQVDRRLNLAAKGSGLRFLGGSVLGDVPPKTVLRPSDTDAQGQRLRELIDRPLPNSRLAEPCFFAAICATQIHFNILDAKFFGALRKLYALEYLFPLLFSNGRVFRDQSAHCIRPLMYGGNFRSDYWACSIPTPIPTTVQDYAQALTNSRTFIRDYSFIAPTRYGTVEFRTGCSQPNAERILEMVALRMALLQLIHKPASLRRRPLRDIFIGACRRGAVDATILHDDIDAIQSLAQHVAPDFDDSLRSAISRLHNGTFSSDQAQGVRLLKLQQVPAQPVLDPISRNSRFRKKPALKRAPEGMPPPEDESSPSLASDGAWQHV